MATSILLDNSYPSSSASSMSSINTPSISVPSLPQSNRRIRFAPLPETRQSVLDLELSDSKQSNYPFDDSSSSSCPPSDSDRPPSPLYCPPSRPTKQQMLAHHSLTPPIHWSKPKSLSLLPFPFKKPSPSPPASTISLTPTPSLDSNPTPTQSRVVSTENVPSTNIFRPSKNNDSPSISSWSFGLSRWSSPTIPKNGSPLARSQSVPTNSTSQPTTKKSFSLPITSTKPRHDSVSSSSSVGSTKQNTRKGHRMLNGRVYGAKRHPGVPTNPFANARDDDDEFVEWGYGGMGSVRGARSAGIVGHADDRDRTKWERLQHNGRNVVAGKSSTERGDIDEEEDDGSGIGWVKKRKAARERKEKEEKERAEAEAAQNSLVQVVSPIPEIVESPVTTSPSRHPSSSFPRSGTPAEEGAPVPEHIYTAVPLPAHLSRHHRRVQSHNPSIDTVPSTATIVPAREDAPVGSDSEPESEDDYGDDEGDEDDDEDDEARRKTALGAGIEKISRHNN